MSEKSSNFAAAFAESDCPGLRDIKPENILIQRESAIRHIPLETNRQNFTTMRNMPHQSVSWHGRWGIVVGFAEPVSIPTVHVIWTH